MLRIIILFFLFTTFQSLSAEKNIDITLGGLPSQLKVVNKFLDHTKNCNVHQKPSQGWDRVTLEFFILCQALHLGGLTPNFTFYEYPNHKRLYIEAIKGKVTMPFVTIWDYEIKPTIFYQTEDLLSNHESEVGIYMLPDKAENTIIASVAELRKYLAVTHFSWTLDIESLKQMNVDYTYATSYENMFKMLKTNRADFLMTSFTSFEDMKQTMGNVTLLPVKGIKIRLSGARSCVVNKNAPQAKLIFNALNKGLKILKDNGKLISYFEYIGFRNPKAKNWKVLCCNSLNISASSAQNTSNKLIKPSQ